MAKSNEESKLLKQLIPTVDPDKFKEIFGFTLDSLAPAKRPPYIVKYRRILGKTILNHKVRAVRILNKTADVYDLTIADNHNFALSAGVFVHNSKDQADAFCGSLYLASKFAEEFAFSYGENLGAELEINILDDVDKKTQMMQDFKNILTELYAEDQRRAENKREEYAYYQDIADGIIVL